MMQISLVTKSFSDRASRKRSSNFTVLRYSILHARYVAHPSLIQRIPSYIIALSENGTREATDELKPKNSNDSI